MSGKDAIPITRLSRRQVYSNQWITLYEDTTETVGQPGQYTVVCRPDAAAVVVRSPSDRLLMVHSFRYPTGQFSLELPTGAVDPGETPAEAARRELLEETSIASDQLTYAGCFFALPGLTDQRVHVFTCIAPDELLESASSAAAEHDIAGVVAVKVDELPRFVAEGRLTDSVTLCGLLLTGISIRRPPELAGG